MKNLRKKSIAVLAGLAVVGLVGASAATLGGINSDNLGADADVVGSCDTDGVDVAYSTTVSGAPAAPVVDAVTISGVDPACDGQVAEVTLTNAANAVLGTVSQTVSLGVGDSFTVSFGAPLPSAEATTGIAIVISG